MKATAFYFAMAVSILTADSSLVVFSAMGGVVFGITFIKQAVTVKQVVFLLIKGVILAVLLTTAVTPLVIIALSIFKQVPVQDLKFAVAALVGFLSDDPVDKIRQLIDLAHFARSTTVVTSKGEKDE